MKRISILLVLSACAPGLCQGPHRVSHSSFSRSSFSYCFSQSCDCLVRYSPYALSYSNSGLIPGGVDYSPYALTRGSSGLVYEGTRYTPYAFNYNSSGLVVDYCRYPIPVCPVQVVVVPCPSPGKASETAIAPGRATMSRSYGRAEEPPQNRQADPMQTIRQYLVGRGFNSIDINYLWHVEGKTVCVSFMLRDKGLAIRYTDPEAIESLATTAQRNSGEQQKQAWEAFAKSFQAGGGSVYSINASGKDQIVAALDACQALKSQDGTATQAVRFAKE